MCMTYQIEFLTAANGAPSVCYVRASDAVDVAGAETQAWQAALGAWRTHHADRFQIRDLSNDQLMVRETFAADAPPAPGLA
jgi:hypothetical protein